MIHPTKKAKFQHGKDADSMLIKKLVSNFLRHGSLITTLKKAKATKTAVERLVEKAKNKTESNKNYLLKTVSNRETISFLFEEVGPSLREKKGGYVRVLKLGERASDGALCGKLEWTHPIVSKKEKNEVQKAKPLEKKV